MDGSEEFLDADVQVWESVQGIVGERRGGGGGGATNVGQELLSDSGLDVEVGCKDVKYPCHCAGGRLVSSANNVLI